MTLDYRVLRRRRRHLWKQNPHCSYCGRLLPWVETTLDHLHPRSRGGTDRWGNLALACYPCNRGKGSHSLEFLVCPTLWVGPILRVHAFTLRLIEMGEPIQFNYDALQEETREFAREHAEAIHQLSRQMTNTVVEIGRRLHEVKARMNTMTWNAWLRAEFRWAQSTASNYMRVFEKFGELDCLDRFQHTALIELSKKRVDARAVDEAVKLASEGAMISRKRARQLMTKFATAENPAPKPDALYHLKTALNRLSGDIASLVSMMTPDDLNALADDLLDLAGKLRKAGTAPKPRRKPTRRSPRVEKSAA